MTDDERGERRTTARKRTIKSGTIVFQNDSCTMTCAILDLAKCSAMLKPLDLTILPERFRLDINHGPSRNCEVVRRTRDQIVVRFV